MTEITRLHEGEKLSRVVIHNGLVYLCGQVAGAYEGDIKEQTRLTLAKIDAHLAEAGTDKSKILTAMVHLNDITLNTQMNEVWNAWLADSHRPARTCVQAELARPNMLVEITLTAAL